MPTSASAGTLTGNPIRQGQLDSLKTELSVGSCSEIVTPFTNLDLVGVDDMIPGTTGTPRMVLRPGLRHGPFRDPIRRVLLMADTGQSPTSTGHRRGLIRHSTTVTTTIMKVGITNRFLILLPAECVFNPKLSHTNDCKKWSS